MSILKDLSESHGSFKVLAVSTASSPLWFLSIFLINKPFYESSDLLIKIILSLTLAMASNFILYFFIFNASGKILQREALKLASVSAFVLFLWKAAFLFTVFSAGYLFDHWLLYYWYVVFYFFSIIILLVSLTIIFKF